MSKEKKQKILFNLLRFGSVEKDAVQELELLDEIKLLADKLGVELIESPKEYALALKSEKKVSEEKTSDSALEVLTLVLYLHPISKAKIDFVRGVNSSASVRKLLLKGYIEKSKKGFVPSAELLASLGVKKAEELDDFYEFRDKMMKLIDDNL